MATITVKEQPAQLVIDLGIDGTATVQASFREVLLNEDGSVRSFTHSRSVTLAELGDDFPWSAFIDPATHAALMKAEATDKLQADLAAAQGKIKNQEALIEEAKALIADREGLTIAAREAFANAANVALAALATLDNEIKARQPKAKAEPGPAETTAKGKRA